MAGLTDQNGTWVIKDDVDLSNLKLETVDVTDGSWTLIDINNGVQTQAFEDGAVKITTNAISAGAINQIGTTSYNAPRWFKKLKSTSGKQVTQNDNFLFITTIQAQSSSNPAPFGFGIGTAIRPYATGSTLETTQLFYAAIVFNDGSGTTGTNNDYANQVATVGTQLGSTRLDSSSIATGVMNYSNKTGIISQVPSSVVGGGLGNIEKTLGTAATGSDDLYVQVGMCARGATHGALSNAVQKQKIAYQVILLG